MVNNWFIYTEFSNNRKLKEWGFPIDVIKNNGEKNNMTTIRESAQAYEPTQTKNISELKSVSTELDIEEREYTDKDSKIFKIKVAVIDDQDYRVPISVLKDLKVMLEDDPDMTEFKVVKKGSGMATKYTVIKVK